MFVYFLILAAILIFCTYKLENNKSFTGNYNPTDREMIEYFVYTFIALVTWYTLGLKRGLIVLVVYGIIDFIIRLITKTNEIDESIDKDKPVETTESKGE